MVHWSLLNSTKPFGDVIGGVCIWNEALIIPSVDQGERPSLWLDELGDVDRKLPNVQEHTAVADENFNVKRLRGSSLSRVADGTKTNFVAI
jgi:hypothetical protein